MRRFLSVALLLFVLHSVVAQNLLAQDLPTIETKTAGMEKMEGFFTIYWDEVGGKVWLEVDNVGSDFIYQVSLAAGLGSNDIGLDRNKLGPTRIVRFDRRGPKVLLMAPNTGYIASSENEAERASVREAFAEGVLHGFDVAAETDDRVDATSFIVRDAHGAISTLSRSGQGSFKMDASRSVPYRENTKSFPENTEMEALLTFTSDNPGGQVRSVAAYPEAIALRERHSFIALPPPGFEPRQHDPRSGFFGPSFLDYSAPIGSDMRTRYIARHRLEKVDPSAAISDPVEPIIYYLDSGTPEPVRSALLEGASWWNQAFEAAGYRDAFRVEMLPDDADPLDVRYNVINWVHRSTRGWSYGNAVTDPRTGEIIKGHVSLGSLRIRQDYLIAEGLLNPYDPRAVPSQDGKDEMLEMALARIRQLSAHEIGHTLGIQHNFAASVNNRASVMDYPAPLAQLTSDYDVTLDQAYATGIGEWDKFTIRYGYSDFPDSLNEKTALDAIISEYVAQGWIYISDDDARPAGGAHPDAHLWDNGTNAVNALELEMAVRKTALDRFGVGSIRPDAPMSLMEEVLVPLYLRHRYQLDAVAKLVGGVRYSYNVRGDRQDFPEAVAPRDQTKATDALIAAVKPAALALPGHIRTQIPPRPPGYGQHRELFDGDTGLIFDPYAPAAVVSHQVFSLLLDPSRTARLIYQKDFDKGQPGLLDILVSVTNSVWLSAESPDGYEAELQRQTQQIWTDMLLTVAASNSHAPGVKARISLHLRDIHAWLTNNADKEGEETQAHRLSMLDEVDRFLFRPYQRTEMERSITIPPGSPIGATTASWLMSGMGSSGELGAATSAWAIRTAQRHAWLQAWIDADTLCRFESR